jgi:hypothetical protein
MGVHIVANAVRRNHPSKFESDTRNRISDRDKE